MLGHSFGGCVALLYAARHPDHPAGLVLQSTMARFDLDRLVAGFRRVAGDDVAALARRDYGGDRSRTRSGPGCSPRSGRGSRTTTSWPAGSGTPSSARTGWGCCAASTRSTSSPDRCPTLVCVGELDPVTPVEAAREIVDPLAPGIARLAVIEGAGHFPWLDQPDRYWSLIEALRPTDRR